MSRKQRQAAYTRTLKVLGEWQKTDPVAFEQTFRQFNYLRSTVYFLLLTYIFQISLVHLLSDSSLMIFQFAQSYPIPAIITLIFSGVLLYVFRGRHRYYYGLTETAFACALIYVSVYQLAQAPSQLLTALGSALYVLVRGLDNLIQGYKSASSSYADKA